MAHIGKSLIRTFIFGIVGTLCLHALYNSQLSSTAESSYDGSPEVVLHQAQHTTLQLKEQTQIPTPSITTGWPIHISIPRVHINVAIIQGEFKNGDWNVSEDFAHYATMTALPNTFNGNTLIYAHNRHHLFYNTLFTIPGDRMYLKTAEGNTFIYEYYADQIVDPYDSSVFYIDGAPQVTLLTCHGENDSHRRLLFFKLVEVV